MRGGRSKGGATCSRRRAGSSREATILGAGPRYAGRCPSRRPFMAREFATTCQAILHHATERPHDDAIIDRKTHVSYRKLARSILQFTEALRELGVAPGEF